MYASVMARLIMEDGSEPGKEFVIGERAVIGRLAANDVALPADENVSRRHARLYLASAGFEIVDLGSSNGTSVNGQRIGASYRLRTGDRIRVGGTTFRFVEEAGGAWPLPAEGRPAAAPSADDVVVRTAPPLKAKAAVQPGNAVTIEIKDETLQFSPYRTAGGAAGFREDLSQRSGLFRLVVILAALAVATALFFAVRALTRSAFAPRPAPESPPR